MLGRSPFDSNRLTAFSFSFGRPGYRTPRRARTGFRFQPCTPNRNNMDSQWFSVNRILGTHLAYTRPVTKAVRRERIRLNEPWTLERYVLSVSICLDWELTLHKVTNYIRCGE